MSKLFKKILVVALCAVSAVLLAFAAAACGDEGGNGGGDKFVITVVYSGGTPVNGHTDGTAFDADLRTETNVKVQFCDSAEDACGTPRVLGTDGKLVIDASTVFSETNSQSVTIKLMGEPEGYTYEKITGATAGSYTITLVRE